MRALDRKSALLAKYNILTVQFNRIHYDNLFAFTIIKNFIFCPKLTELFQQMDLNYNIRNLRILVKDNK